jgi:hypothetical protein
MKKAYRHGEIALIAIDKLPDNLKPSESKILMEGSHGNNHSFDSGVFYPHKDGIYIFGYLKAENTNLLHTEHGEGKKQLKTAKIPDGFYELRKQNEVVNNELKQVID